MQKHITDLSCFREDGSKEWYNEELARIGEQRMREMYNSMYRLAAKMPCGSSINLLNVCKNPENLRLAVKICCEIIDTYRHGKTQKCVFEFADSDYTIFRKVAI